MPPKRSRGGKGKGKAADNNKKIKVKEPIDIDLTKSEATWGSYLEVIDVLQHIITTAQVKPLNDDTKSLATELQAIRDVWSAKGEGQEQRLPLMLFLLRHLQYLSLSAQHHKIVHVFKYESEASFPINKINAIADQYTQLKSKVGLSDDEIRQQWADILNVDNADVFSDKPEIRRFCVALEWFSSTYLAYDGQSFKVVVPVTEFSKTDLRDLIHATRHCLLMTPALLAAPASPPWCPSSPAYGPDSPHYSPQSPAYTPDPEHNEPDSPHYSPQSPAYTPDPRDPGYYPTSPKLSDSHQPSPSEQEDKRVYRALLAQLESQPRDWAALRDAIFKCWIAKRGLSSNQCHECEAVLDFSAGAQAPLIRLDEQSADMGVRCYCGSCGTAVQLREDGMLPMER